MMTITISTLSTLFFVAIRLGTVLLFSPIEAIRILPIHTRLLFVMIISGLIVANLSFTYEYTQELSLALSSLAEFFNGLILSLSLYATFAIFQIAGQLIDTQIGLNSLAILNPADHSHELLSSRLLHMLAVLFFFALDGHHKLLQGLAASFKLMPPGSLKLFNGFLPVIEQFSCLFSLSFMIASPIIASLLIIDITGALLTRNMPQVSTYFLILPIKIMLGLFILSLMLNYLNPIMNTLFQLFFQQWQKIMS